MRKVVSKFVFLIVLTAGVFATTREAFADFTFTASPRRGGNGIYFEQSVPGQLPRTEEATLTVTSTEGAQYRILQTVYQPLTNEFGDTLPQEAFILFSPSSPLGELRIQQETPVVLGQTPIFTSDSGGSTDSFVVAYNARVPENQAGGIYRTTLSFTAELVTSRAGISPVVVTLDVRLEIRPKFRVAIQNSKGGRDLDLGRIGKDRPSASETLVVRIESNIGTTYRLVQSLQDMPMSPEGEFINPDRFLVAASGGGEGSLSLPSQEKVPTAPKIFYTSGSGGQGDEIRLEYALDPGEQKAGNYTATLLFKVESDSSLVPAEIIQVPVRIEIEPIFYLDVKLPQGSGFHFGAFGGKEQEGRQRAEITVHTNLGQPYVISHISRKLVSTEGSEIPEENFLFYGEGIKTGALTATTPSPVKEGESVIYTSDKSGKPAEFTIHYLLTVPEDARAGSYRSEIRYSITTV